MYQSRSVRRRRLATTSSRVAEMAQRLRKPRETFKLNPLHCLLCLRSKKGYHFQCQERDPATNRCLKCTTTLVSDGEGQIITTLGFCTPSNEHCSLIFKDAAMPFFLDQILEFRCISGDKDSKPIRIECNGSLALENNSFMGKFDKFVDEHYAIQFSKLEVSEYYISVCRTIGYFSILFGMDLVLCQGTPHSFRGRFTVFILKRVDDLIGKTMASARRNQVDNEARSGLGLWYLFLLAKLKDLEVEGTLSTLEGKEVFNHVITRAKDFGNEVAAHLATDCRNQVDWKRNILKVPRKRIQELNAWSLKHYTLSISPKDGPHNLDVANNAPQQPPSNTTNNIHNSLCPGGYLGSPNNCNENGSDETPSRNTSRRTGPQLENAATPPPTHEFPMYTPSTGYMHNSPTPYVSGSGLHLALPPKNTAPGYAQSAAITTGEKLSHPSSHQNNFQPHNYYGSARPTSDGIHHARTDHAESENIPSGFNAENSNLDGILCVDSNEEATSGADLDTQFFSMPSPGTSISQQELESPYHDRTTANSNFESLWDDLNVSESNMNETNLNFAS